MHLSITLKVSAGTEIQSPKLYRVLVEDYVTRDYVQRNGEEEKNLKTLPVYILLVLERLCEISWFRVIFQQMRSSCACRLIPPLSFLAFRKIKHWGEGGDETLQYNQWHAIYL